jgi:predicted nucleic acid-binding protein
MTPRLVVDASVAAKWFLKDATEEDVILAENILQSSLDGNLELHAPHIFRTEVCGILARACLTRFHRGSPPRLRKEQAQRHIRTLFALPIRLDGERLAGSVEAFDFAVDYSKGYYDMTYLRLAEALNCQWCTADARVLAPTRTGFPTHCVLLLSSLRVEAT